jgi:hypothetical protein
VASAADGASRTPVCDFLVASSDCPATNASVTAPVETGSLDIRPAGADVNLPKGCSARRNRSADGAGSVTCRHGPHGAQAGTRLGADRNGAERDFSRAFTRLMEKMLFDVHPLDPPAFVAATLVLGTFACLACYLPARRATRVDPLQTLRRGT